MGEPLLQIDDLSCGYGGADVLHGVSLAVSGGELAGLVGPNGAGKTTLFRAVTGAVTPRAGRILLAGRPLAELGPRETARRLALAPQLLDVPFSFTVQEFVALGRLPHLGRFAAPGPGDREAVRRAAVLMDLEGLADRPLDTLSGGERQRAVIAQALAQEPKVLLLDEPAAHLDVSHQVEVFELLDRVRGDGVAVLAVLHDLNLAAEYCERLVLLREGRVFADGSPASVLTPERLDQAFGVRLDVALDPVSGRPAVRFRRPRPSGPPGARPRVHVVCGGGTGSALLRRLRIEGFEVSAGVLNEGDSDLALARSLGIPAAAEAPFSPIGEAAAREARGMLEASDAAVVSAVPFGRGNLKNLEILPADRAPRTILVEASGARDFTDGRASALLEALRRAGAKSAASDREAMEALREILARSRPAAERKP